MFAIDCGVESRLPIGRLRNFDEPHVARDLAMRKLVAFDRTLCVFAISIWNGRVDRFENDERQQQFLHRDEKKRRATGA